MSIQQTTGYIRIRTDFGKPITLGFNRLDKHTIHANLPNGQKLIKNPGGQAIVIRRRHYIPSALDRFGLAWKRDNTAPTTADFEQSTHIPAARG